MTTCYLFAHGLNEEGCLSLCLDDKGNVTEPLIHRSFSDIKILQKPYILVLPTEFFSLHTLDLPWIAEKKARVAIPFGIEEQLTQPVSELHFAFDRAFHQDGQYLIVVGEKTYLAQLMEQFRRHHIILDKITLDWFCLDHNESIITKDKLLIRSKNFQGILDTNLTSSLFNLTTQLGSDHVSDHKIYTYKAETNFLNKNNITGTEVETELEVWIAQKLQQRKMINLCQGEFQPKHLMNTAKRYYALAAGMSLLWFFSFLVIHIAQLYPLNQQLIKIDSEIASLYAQFFPQAKQVINPKFRINQLLKTSQNKTNLNCWTLLNLVAKELSDEALLFEKIHFQNQTLSITFSTKTFDALEDFQNRLQQSQAKVKQTQAATQQEKIIGTLELSL